VTADNDFGRFGSGHSVRRIEDPALITGRGRYVDDFAPAGLLHLVFVRSPMAHAQIESIDLSAALATPGVVAAFTGKDLVAAGVKPFAGPPPIFKRPDGTPPPPPDRHAIAPEIVRFVGEAVAVVIATSPDAALAGRDAVMVDYRELPAVGNVSAALAPDAPQVWSGAPGNVVAETRYGNREAADQAFAAAAHVVSLDLDNQRLAPASIEPRSVLASFDPADGRTTLRMSSQMPSGARNTIADQLGLTKDQVRVLVGDVGGGFGMKTGAYPEDVAVAFVARQMRASVKWIAERSEEFLTAVHGRGLRSQADLALNEDGRVLALRVRTQANVGAHPAPTGCAIPLLIGPWITTSIYDIGTIDLHIQAVLTNTTPLGAYRGAGRPEAVYVIERLMSAAALKTGIDPIELRRRNMVRPEQMPYKNAMGQVYDTGNFPSIMAQGVELADWNGFEARAKASREQGRLRGRGIATFLEWTGGNVLDDRVTVNVTADGFIEIFTATQAMGQGIATTYAQLAVDSFGVPLERIRIIQGDTDRGEGFGSAGSRSLFTAGSALQAAAVKVLDIAKQKAADALEAPAADLEYEAGRFQVAGTDLQISLFDVAAREASGSIFLESVTKVDGPSWPNGCHVCEVEVDPDTGEVVIDRYSSVNDVGRVVNPMIVLGQVDGGAVQGIGQALCEQLVYDDQAQLVTASFLDYAMPRAGIVKRFETRLDQSVPCKANPLGVKGVGELGTIGATPAVVNAVVDALARNGLGERATAIQMPLTSERVWRALQGLSA
jgi:carbon-monoxide dehydrogenase large subunit